MKKLIISLSAVTLSIQGFAQAIGYFNYNTSGRTSWANHVVVNQTGELIMAGQMGGSGFGNGMPGIVVANSAGAYFVYNGDPNGSGTVNPYKSNNQYIQFDGYTTKITARAAVTCGTTYHLKLAVGDARDQSYTSGVFIRGNLATYPPSITQTINQTCSLNFA